MSYFQGHNGAPVARVPFCSVQDQRDQVFDESVSLDGMAQRLVQMQLVPVSSALAFAFQIARVLELADNALHTSLGDADR